MQITICGGGNAAHTLAGLLGNRKDTSVRLYAPLGDEAERWREGVQKNGGIIVQTPENTLVGMPDAICNDPEEAVSGSQVVLLALPAFAHESILQQVAPFLSPGAWVGAMPARGGFDLCVRDVLKERTSEVCIFGFQTLPWACRIQQYGQQATIYGTKEQVDLTAWPQGQAPVISSLLGELLGIRLNPIASFLSLTLADTGQLIHPGIMYGLFHEWDGRPYAEHRLFYQSVDARMAATLQSMSDEVQGLRSYLENEFSDLDLSAVRPLGEWLERSYRSKIVDRSTLHLSFSTNRSYEGLLAPMYKTYGGFVPDFKARYLSEDVPFDLLVTRGIAELAGVDTPAIDKVLSWAQDRLEKEYLVAGKLHGAHLPATRTPQRYGFADLHGFMRSMQYIS